MKMRFLTILLLLAVFVFISCDGSSMEKLWKDELGNGSGSGSDPTPPPAPVTCTVTFDANGGTGTMDDAIVEKGVAYTVPASEFTAPAFTAKTDAVPAVHKNFACWNTKADGSGTAYAVGEEILSVTADITLYAQWAKPSFSVSADRKVYFAKGNLQATYNGTDYSWGFAENQYVYIGNAAGNTTIASQTPGAKVDLFGWSTDGGGATGYVPWGINTATYDESFNPVAYYGDFVDWGTAIGDGNIWSTLTREEWTYLLFQRTMTYGKDRYSNAVSGVSIEGTIYKGLFLYPDNYNGNVVSNTMTWGQINAAGIVFLPAAGSRDSFSVSGVGDDGFYWSSTANDVPPTPGGDPSGTAIGMSLFNLNYFNNSYAIVTIVRCQGCSVRLVCGE